MDETDDDTGLARRFRAGEPGALGEVVRRYGPTLRSISRSRLRDHQLADDAVQLAYVRAWRAAGRVDPARPMGAWLATICRRTCVDVHRRNRRAADEVTRTGTLEEVGGRAAAPPTGVEAEVAIEAVRRAVARLPRDERDVVRHAYVDGLSYAEIADRLAVPLGTVKSRAFRAHRRLARTLDPIGAAV